ncbi:Gustatory receptor for sugar taste 64f [Folsomia candida]|uniref:Gustatory receptor for sugar taste 64f n=1 Tax=Folsomia candida TaxID=158441 RepID=A0A226DVL2_FOLCA|nr:Gustatory receptor for sugar taste 64f [Folsomia candida]
MISRVDVTSDIWHMKSDLFRSVGIAMANPITEMDRPSLKDKLRYYLIFGRVLGILPIQGVFQRDSKLTFKKFSLASFTTLAITVSMGAYAMFHLVQGFRKKQTTAPEIAWACLLPSVYTFGTVYCLVFLMSGNRFCKLFSTWKNLSSLHFPVEDTTFSRDVGIWIGMIFTSTFLSSVSWPFVQAHAGWDVRSGYPIWDVIIFILSLINQYNSNYIDVLIGIFARAVYGQFKGLREICKKIVQVNGRIMDANYYGDDAVFWEFLVSDHGILCQIMEVFKEFLSPIIFVTYAANMFWTCLVVLFILAPIVEPNWIYKSYSIWNMLHMVVRFFTMSLLAAKVSTHANNFAEILEQCPIEMYTRKVARFERKLQTAKIAFTGLNCFSITKPVILSIVGVLVTFEIVLLHAMPGETGAKNFEKLYPQRVACQFECIFDAESNAVNGFDLRGPRDLAVTVVSKSGLFVMSHINSNVFLTLNPNPSIAWR